MEKPMMHFVLGAHAGHILANIWSDGSPISVTLKLSGDEARELGRELLKVADRLPVEAVAADFVVLP